MFKGAFLNSIGLKWRLLVPSTLAAIICIVAVQSWTLDLSGSALEQRMNSNLDVSLSLLRSYLGQAGTDWSFDAGKLKLGTTAASDLVESVDKASNASKGVATIFSGDERVATSVRKPDGARAVGTHLTDDKVREAVLRQGATYRGQTTILGQRYLTIYEPIRDAADKIVGILFVGLPTEELEAVKRDVIIQGAGVAALVVLLFAGANAWLMAWTLKPLDRLIVVMRRIAHGELGVEIPGAERNDQVGRMSSALQTFREAALDKLKMQSEADAAGLVSDQERSAREAHRANAATQLGVVVRSLETSLHRLSDGDLLVRIKEPFAPEYESLRLNFNEAVEKLAVTVTTVVQASQAIATGVQQITSASEDLARRTERQAATLEESTAALRDLAHAVNGTAEHSIKTKDIISAAKSDTLGSADVVRKTIAAISGIMASSQKIETISGVIDEIAFQTNLLALNAGVEAARAGDAGRGFAVVATEVRALAHRSAEAAKEIKSLISSSVREVGEGVKLVGETGRAFDRINDQISIIDGGIAGIAGQAVEQSSTLKQVNTAVGELDQSTQQNAAMAEQATAACQSLIEQTSSLARMVSQFVIVETGSSSSMRKVSARHRSAA